jgi:hypothetical protein
LWFEALFFLHLHTTRFNKKVVLKISTECSQFSRKNTTKVLHANRTPHPVHAEEAVAERKSPCVDINGAHARTEDFPEEK